jgi:hypothetical protein
VFADSFGHYAQVTTAEFPDGAVRGQFSADVFGDLSFEPRTGPLAVPDGAREGEAFFAAVCFDAATRTFVGYLSFDVFRITPLAKAAAVRVEPSFTG